MSRFQRPVRPSTGKDPVFKFEMKGEEELVCTITDLERQMHELIIENLELKLIRDSLKNEMEGMYRTLSTAHLATIQDLQCPSIRPEQDGGSVFQDFDSKKIGEAKMSIGGVKEQLSNGVRSQWRLLKKHVERLQAQASRPAGHRRDSGLSSTDHDKEIAKLKEELRDAKIKLAAKLREAKSQEQEVQELRCELAESRKEVQSRDLQLEQLRHEVLETKQIAQNRLMELEKLKQEKAKCQQEADRNDQELAALKQAAAERRVKDESPELEALRKEIAENRELICQQQQLLQEQLTNSLSSELPTPIQGSYFLEEQLQLQEDRAVFEEQKRIFQGERRNFTEAAIRLGHEKLFEEEKGLLAKYSFLNSSLIAAEKEPASWKINSSCGSHGSDVHTLMEPVLLLKPICTPFTRNKTPGVSTPKFSSECRISARNSFTPSTAEHRIVLKLTPDQRLLSTTAADLSDYPNDHAPQENCKKTPVWKKPVPTAVLSPESYSLPDYVLRDTTVFSPHRRTSSSVETTPQSESRNESLVADISQPSTAELYRVLGLTSQSRVLDQSLVSDSKEILEHTYQVCSRSSSASRRGSLTYTLLEDQSHIGHETNGNTQSKDPYSEVCSNLLSRFLDISF